MPQAQDPSMMPVFPSLNEGSRKRQKLKAQKEGDIENDLRQQRETQNQGFYMA